MAKGSICPRWLATLLENVSEQLFFCGSKPIDGVWATQDIVITHVCDMPAGFFGIGDHRMFVIDVQEKTILGTVLFRVKRFASRRLNTKVSNCANQKYLAKLEEGLSQHRLIEKIGKLHMQFKSKKKFQNELNKLDQQSKDMMINAENKCRWIKSGWIPFAHTSLQVPITLPTWPDQEHRQSEEDQKEVQHSTMPFNSRRQC
jgi:hypothetical protein